MANATSTFLQGANSAFAGAPAPAVPDENAILSAISAPPPSTLSSLADQFGTSQQMVAPVIDGLLRAKLIESNEGVFNLSANGDRALRFAGMAKI